MHRKLGSNLFTLTDEHDGRATRNGDVIVERGEPTIAVRRGERMYPLLLPMDAVSKVTRFLSGKHADEHLSVDAFLLMESETYYGSRCASCSDDTVPDHDGTYVFQQFWHPSNPSGLLTLTVHRPCAQRFTELLEQAWEHADALLGSQL